MLNASFSETNLIKEMLVIISSPPASKGKLASACRCFVFYWQISTSAHVAAARLPDAF